MEGKIFLFNVREDISEMENVADQHPDIINALQQEYNNFMATLDSVENVW